MKFNESPRTYFFLFIPVMRNERSILLTLTETPYVIQNEDKKGEKV